MQTSLIVQTLSIMREGRFNEITTAESTRWRSAVMPIWAAETGFSPSKQQFSRVHAASARVWRRTNLRLCAQPSECQGASRPRALFCRRGKAAGPPVGLSCEGPSGVGRGRTTAAIDPRAFSAKAAKRSGMCCGEARKPSRKARRCFGPPAVALGLESRASSCRSPGSFRLKRPGLDQFGA